MSTSEQQKLIDVGIDPAEVAQKVRKFVADSLEIDVEEVELSSSLFDLGAESLDMIDMAFAIEREYKIQFPRTDILERSMGHFGENALIADGIVTDFGLEMLRRSMPEVDPTKIKTGLTALDVAKMFTVNSFVRITLRLLEAKAAYPRACPVCSTPMVESVVMPELECPSCHKIVPLPNGDEILLNDMVAAAKEIKQASVNGEAAIHG